MDAAVDRKGGNPTGSGLFDEHRQAALEGELSEATPRIHPDQRWRDAFHDRIGIERDPLLGYRVRADDQPVQSVAGAPIPLAGNDRARHRLDMGGREAMARQNVAGQRLGLVERQLHSVFIHAHRHLIETFLNGS
jgi:hypothetical protein